MTSIPGSVSQRALVFESTWSFKARCQETSHSNPPQRIRNTMSLAAAQKCFHPALKAFWAQSCGQPPWPICCSWTNSSKTAVYSRALLTRPWPGGRSLTPSRAGDGLHLGTRLFHLALKWPSWRLRPASAGQQFGRRPSPERPLCLSGAKLGLGPALFFYPAWSALSCNWHRLSTHSGEPISFYWVTLRGSNQQKIFHVCTNASALKWAPRLLTNEHQTKID